MGQAGLTKYRVKTIISKIPTDLDGDWNDLPTGEVHLLGEFLHHRRAGANYELTLLDTRDPTFSMMATLPVSISLPPKGRVLGVFGRLSMRCEGRGSSGKFKIFFDGDNLDDEIVEGRLFREQHEVFEQFAEAVEEYRDVELAQVRTVALITGMGVAAKDFTDNLNPPHRPEIRLKTLTTRLWDAPDIAEKIQRATEDPEVDVIVVARGGGSPEELHTFEHVDVIRALGLAVQKKYVVTAIGHARKEMKCDQLAHHWTNVPADAGAYLRQREAQIFFARRGRQREAAPLAPSLPEKSTALVEVAQAAEVRRVKSGSGITYQYLPAPVASTRHRRSLPTYMPTQSTLGERLRSLVRYRVVPFTVRWTKRAVLVALGFSVGWVGKRFDRPAVSVAAPSTAPKETAVERAPVPETKPTTSEKPRGRLRRSPGASKVTAYPGHVEKGK